MLTELRSIVNKVTSSQSLDEALFALVRLTKQAMNLDCCSVYLADYARQEFVLMASDGLAVSAQGQASVSFNEGVVGLVGQREEPINLADVQSHPRFKYLPEVQEDQFRSFLGTPIIHQRKVLGVLVAQQVSLRSFDESEESFVVTLAAQLATVIAHALAVGFSPSSLNQQQSKVHHGVSGSAGVAVAPAFVAKHQDSLMDVVVENCSDMAFEKQVILKATERTRAELYTLSEQLSAQLPKDVLAIFESYQHMLAEQGLLGDILNKIDENYKACSAIKLVVDNYVSQFELMSDPYLKERASDVRDLGQRLLQQVLRSHLDLNKLPENFILVANEVTASMLAEYPSDRLQGIVSVKGGANSHAAILSRAMGIPAIMGLDIAISQLSEQELIVNGYNGELIVSPGDAVRNEYLQLQEQELELQKLVISEADQAAVSLDGHRAKLLINAGLSADSSNANQLGEDGVGLYRTEIPFILRDSFPSEQEQYALYKEILSQYKGKSVCMRTLDVGGDKQLPYFPIIEENPFLGWRGIRLTLDHPEIFLLQAKAMYRAGVELGNLSIMLPMVSDLGEMDEAIRLLDQAWYEVLDKYDFAKEPVRPQLGVMIEVPSAIYLLPELAERVDFWSVGSNDLTQYMLAVDRNNVRVAKLYDTFHPAVLRALNDIIQQAQRYNVPVSVCGELAGDPVGAVILMAMGYRKLSMNGFNLARIKYVLRHSDLGQLQRALQRALAMDTGVAIRELFADYLEQQGVGGLVRAGK